MVSHRLRWALLWGLTCAAGGASGEGRPDVFLNALDGSDGFRVDGGLNGLRSATFAGDTNGDGYTDLAFGDPLYDFGAGAVYRLMGAPVDFPATLGKITDLLGDWAVRSEGKGGACEDAKGRQIGFAGDQSEDGTSDVVWGNPDFTCQFYEEGTWGLVYGKERSPWEPAPLEQRSARGEGELFREGFVSSAADFDGDGLANDFLIGAPGYPGPYIDRGRVELQSTTGGFLRPEFQGRVGEFIGESVTELGDFNGDGYDDLALGGRGVGYLVYGRAEFPELLLGGVADPESHVRLVGFDLREVVWPGDVNGDDHHELLLTVEGLDRAYLLFGGPRFFDEAELNIPREVGRHVVAIVAPSEALFGAHASRAGDLNRDGFDDFVLSADGGRSHVVFGRRFWPDVLVLPPAYTPELAETEGFLVHGSASDGPLLVEYAGDFNHDGFDDVLFGDNRSAFVLFHQNPPPSVTAAGSCPGEIDLLFTGLEPFEEVAVAEGPAIGLTAVSDVFEGSCEESLFALEGAEEVAVLAADPNGEARFTYPAADGGCGARLQGVSLGRCQRTNSLRLTSAFERPELSPTGNGRADD